MSFLRGNFRKRALDVSYDGIGGAIANWIQGSNIQGPDRQYGGFLIASFASQFSAGGALIVSAQDLISSTYGVTLASNVTVSGYKAIITNFMDYSGDGTSAIVFYHLSVTGALAGDDSILVVIGNKVSATVASGVTLLSNQSVHFLMQGWIVSTPFAVH